MPTAKKPTTTSVRFSPAEVEAAKAAAASVRVRKAKTDWSKGTVTAGGGVAATAAEIRRTRGAGKKPAKEQVAIRLDTEALGPFRAGGPGWQTRVNAALKDWLAAQGRRAPGSRKSVG